LQQLGLDLAHKHRPRLILLDLHLPDLPASACRPSFHVDNATREPLVIVLSADDATRDN
jgi:DNA-binding response OmpR family regulator